MALGLSNAKLSVMGANSAPPPVQKVKPARPSIAEDAIFIPKPHKRVEFKLETQGVAGGNGSAGSTESGSAPRPPLLGESSDGSPAQTGVSGKFIASGSLGIHGVSAEFGKDSYLNSAPKIKMEVDNTPTKDFSTIPTQEEGRQSNHAKQVNYTQQYDSYGRPRIGFSREPYDFAATKYVAKTSQLKFQENMEADKEASTQRQASPPSPVQDAAAAKAQGMLNPDNVKGTTGMVDPAELKDKMPGASKLPKAGMIDINTKDIQLLGEKPALKPGEVQTAPPAGNGQPGTDVFLKGESAAAVAEKTGLQSSGTADKPDLEAGINHGGVSAAEAASMMTSGAKHGSAKPDKAAARYASDSTDAPPPANSVSLSV